MAFLDSFHFDVSAAEPLAVQTRDTGREPDDLSTVAREEERQKDSEEGEKEEEEEEEEEEEAFADGRHGPACKIQQTIVHSILPSLMAVLTKKASIYHHDVRMAVVMLCVNLPVD